MEGGREGGREGGSVWCLQLVLRCHLSAYCKFGV